MIRPGETPGSARYYVKPLVVPVVSGYLPAGARGRRGIFAPSAPEGREERVAVPTREVVCYECGKKTHIPAAALSAHCVHCRAHLNTANIVLKSGTHRLTVRTLGDVSVPANVALSKLSITCRNLNVSGKASGTMHCTGEIHLRGKAVVEGQVQGATLVVAAGAQASCSPAISVETAQIEGRLKGPLHASGTVYIGRAGVLEGDCRAEHVHYELGGRHVGNWIRIMS